MVIIARGKKGFALKNKDMEEYCRGVYKIHVINLPTNGKLWLNTIKQKKLLRSVKSFLTGIAHFFVS